MHNNIEKMWLDNMANLDKYNMWVFRHIEEYLGDYVWEVGAGVGAYSKFLLGRTQLILSDIVDEYLEILKSSFKKYDNVKVFKLDLLDSSDSKVILQYRIDTILCINVLEHVKNDLKAIEFMYRILKKNGVFIFIGPNHKFLFNSLDKYANHFRRYSIKEMSFSLTKVGFIIEKAFSFNRLVALAWFWHGSVLRRKVIPRKSLSYYNILIPIANIVDLIIPFKFGGSIAIIARKK